MGIAEWRSSLYYTRQFNYYPATLEGSFAMFPHADLATSTTFQRVQRALAPWLESSAAAAPFGLRAMVGALPPIERVALARWLHWHGYAARRNGNASLSNRIERIRRALEPTASPNRRSRRPELVLPKSA